MRPFPPDFSSFTDEALCQWVIQERPDWQRAYEELFVDRYGKKIRNAVIWVAARSGVSPPFEDVFSHLLWSLRGTKGGWTNLKSWNKEKGEFSGWVWVVARNTCRRILSEEGRGRSDGSLNLETKQLEPGYDPPVPDAGNIAVLNRLLKELGGVCEKMLRRKYFDGIKDEDIGRELGVGRERANRKRRQCEKLFKSLMEQKRLHLSDFVF